LAGAAGAVTTLVALAGATGATTTFVEFAGSSAFLIYVEFDGTDLKTSNFLGSTAAIFMSTSMVLWTVGYGSTEDDGAGIYMLKFYPSLLFASIFSSSSNYFSY